MPRTTLRNHLPIGVVRILRSIQDSFPLAMITIDLEGSVSSWNTAAARLYGWDADEVLGEPIVDLVTNATNEPLARSILRSLARGDVWFGRFPSLTANGTMIDIGVLNLPIIDENGRFAGVIGFSQSPSANPIHGELEIDELRDLADRLDAIRALEQQRIGAQLHDRLSQPIAMSATELLALTDRDDISPEVGHRLETIASNLRFSLTILQNLSSSFRPDWNDSLPPYESIDEMVRSWSYTSAITARILIDDRVNELDRTTVITILRIIKEALANIERHADARVVTVSVDVAEGLVTVRIVDDGVGYDGSIGFGIRLMRERTRRHGGTLTVTGLAAPRPGTAVELRLPTPPPRLMVRSTTQGPTSNAGSKKTPVSLRRP